MGVIAVLSLFLMCFVGLLILGAIFAVFRLLFGWRYRRWGHPGYYGPRPFFSWFPFFGGLFGGPFWGPRFFEPYREFHHHEHWKHMHRHHPGGYHGGWGGGHHGGHY
jgi:hypothetical protein